MHPSRPARLAPEANTLTQAAVRRPFSQTKGAALLAVLLLPIIAGALTLPGLWRETARREASLPQLEAQAASSPGDGPLLALVGAGRMAAGENRGAADALRQAIASGESNEDTWEALAANTAAAGDRRRALADLHLGLAALPLSIGLQNALARARVENVDAPPPVLAAAIDPQGPLPLRDRYAAGSRLNGLAEWWGQHHLESSGVMTRSAWARARPGDAQAQRLWGQALLTDRRQAEAGPVLVLAHSLAPDSPAAGLALADYYAQAGNAPQAALQYLACLKLRPGWPAALIGYGTAALQNGQVPPAVAAFTTATRLAPRNADAWIGLGQAQLKTGVAFTSAITAFQTAARLIPDRTEYFNSYADALRHGGRAPEAEALLRRRLQAAPGDALAHYLLGLILRDTDPTVARVAEAEAQTRESLRLSPHNPLASAQLGQILLDAGRTDAAVALFEDARAHTPDDPNLLLVLARAYGRQGKPLRAAQTAARARSLLADQQRAAVLTDAARKQPLDIGLHRQLAVLYARTGKPEQARREEDTIRLLQADPKGTARQMGAFSDSLQNALAGR